MGSDVLPAGRYAVLIYKGVKNGDAANSQDSPNGHIFQSRYETFLTDAVVEPNQDEWEAEIAIKLRG